MKTFGPKPPLPNFMTSQPGELSEDELRAVSVLFGESFDELLARRIAARPHFPGRGSHLRIPVGAATDDHWTAELRNTPAASDGEGNPPPRNRTIRAIGFQLIVGGYGRDLVDYNQGFDGVVTQAYKGDVTADRATDRGWGPEYSDTEEALTDEGVAALTSTDEEMFGGSHLDARLVSLEEGKELFAFLNQPGVRVV